MKFYYVYILHNSAKDFLYIGYSEDLKQRVISHNKGENTSTKPYIPLELIHYEAYRNMEDAKRRELYLKSNKGKTTMMTMLQEYFEEIKNPSPQPTQPNEKEQKTCPICGGSGKAPNDMGFYRGNRYTKNVVTCLTCMGKGTINSNQHHELRSVCRYRCKAGWTSPYLSTE